jgi:hypothetical protein
VKQIRNDKNQLTAYGFACGYIEELEYNNRRIQLWHEHGTYHVRAHDYNTHTRLFWECFDKLADARRYYNKQSITI